jgi:2-dehydro-3-deoxyglucarate aldolase/4-hydroxy-2-oxoheptanedioate aldolase
VLAVVQIESRQAVEQVEEIAALDGVDVLFVGPRDLSHDLGVPGDLQAPSYLDALDRVRRAARQFGRSCGVLVLDGAAAAEKHAQGWTFVTVASDSALLAAALTAELARARLPE